MGVRRKYEFSWRMLGNLDIGRPTLGVYTDVAVYRMLKQSLSAVVEEMVGEDTSAKFFRDAGVLVGLELGNRFLKDKKTAESYIEALQQLFKEYRMGILSINDVQGDYEEIAFSLIEDTGCSGITAVPAEIIAYSEGFSEGLFKNVIGRTYTIKLTESWNMINRSNKYIAKWCKTDAKSS